MTGIIVIAHAPLASALGKCAEHVYSCEPNARRELRVLDVNAGADLQQTVAQARRLVAEVDRGEGVLVLTDVFGATPCNVAQKLVDGVHSKLITGVNLPMLLRTVSYRHEPLDALVARAVMGGTQGVMQVAITAPQNQAPRNHDKEQHDHQQ
ncbi:MAG: PTS sugar transporter subunit IIA [Burkholderiaceae bacterium]